MAWLTKATVEELSEDSKKFLEERGADYINSKKGPYLLKNAVVYQSIEKNAWGMDDEVQRLIGKRLGDLLEYVISKENGAPVCTPYFEQCLKDQGIDFETTEFNEKEQLIIEYAKYIVNDRHHIPAEFTDRLKAAFTEEEIVVITGMAAVIYADNIFETTLDLH